MTEALSSTPSLLEQRASKKRSIQKWISDIRSQPLLDPFTPPSMPVTPIPTVSQPPFYPPYYGYPTTSYAPNTSQNSGYTVIVNPRVNSTQGYPGAMPVPSVAQTALNQPPIPGPMPAPIIAGRGRMATPPEMDRVAASMSNMNLNAAGNVTQPVYPQNTYKVAPVNPVGTAANGTKGQSTTISVYPPGTLPNSMGPRVQPTTGPMYPPSPMQNPMGAATVQNTVASAYAPNAGQNPVSPTGQTTVTTVNPPVAAQDPITRAVEPTVPPVNSPSPTAANAATGQSTVVSVYPPGTTPNPVDATAEAAAPSVYPRSPVQNPLGAAATNATTSTYPYNIPQNPIEPTGQTTVTSVNPLNARNPVAGTIGQTTVTTVYPPNPVPSPIMTTGQPMAANIGQSSVPTPLTVPAPITTSTYTPPPITAAVPAPATYTRGSPYSSTYSSPYSSPGTQFFPMVTGTQRSYRNYEPTVDYGRSGRSRSLGRTMHRSELDDMARDTALGTRAVDQPVNIPPDYVPVSGGTRHRRTVSATSPALISSRSRSHGALAVPPIEHNDSLTLPHYHSSHRHRDSSPHRHHHHHGGHRHSPHHRDYAYVPSKHRSLSQAPRVHYEVPPVRPTYSRHRSRSLDAGNPRMTTRSKPTGIYASQAQAQPQYYPQQSSTQAATVNAVGNYHVIHPSSTSPTVIQQSSYQPVMAPVGGGRSGYVVVPPVGQNMHVVSGHRHSNSMGTGRDVRAAQSTSAPGFFGRIFGSKAQPTTNVGQTAGVLARR